MVPNALKDQGIVIESISDRSQLALVVLPFFIPEVEHCDNTGNGEAHILDQSCQHINNFQSSSPPYNFK